MVCYYQVPPVDQNMRNDLLSGGGRFQQQGSTPQGGQSYQRPAAPSPYSSYTQGPPAPASGSSQSKSKRSGADDDTSSVYSAAPSYYSSYDPRARQSQPAGSSNSGGGGYPQQQQQGRGYASNSYQDAQAMDPARRELFKDAKPPRASFGAQNLDDPYSAYGKQQSSSSSSSRYQPNPDDPYRENREDGGDQEGGGQMNEEDEEVEAVKQQMRFTKQESLASTRNALRAAREAAEVGSNTLVKLGDQSERLANTERALDMTKAYNDRAADEAKEIKSLNRSIFRPNFSFNKTAKRDAAERKILERHHEERNEREETRRQVFESRQRIGDTFRQAEMEDRSRQTSQRYGSQAANQAVSKLQGRSRYQFEADEEDDQVEDEINQNLDEISALSKNLNLLARAAGEEVRTQNQKLDSLNYKTDRVDSKIVQNGIYLNRIK